MVGGLKYGLSRRMFTKLGVLGGAGALVLPLPGAAAPVLSSGVVLSDDERELVERFAEVYLPTDGTPLKPRLEVPVADNIQHAFSLMDEPTLEQVRIGLKLFNYGSIVIGFHLARFVQLSTDDRLAYIRAWENGVAIQRGILTMLKKLICYGYWSDIEAGRTIGYRGPVSVIGGVPSLGNAPMPRPESE